MFIFQIVKINLFLAGSCCYDKKIFKILLVSKFFTQQQTLQSASIYGKDQLNGIVQREIVVNYQVAIIYAFHYSYYKLKENVGKYIKLADLLILKHGLQQLVQHYTFCFIAIIDRRVPSVCSRKQMRQKTSQFVFYLVYPACFLFILHVSCLCCIYLTKSA